MQQLAAVYSGNLHIVPTFCIRQSDVDIEVAIDQDKIRPVDVPIIEADIQKIYNCTGWEPQISLKQTLKETLDYWRCNSNA